MTWLLAFFLTLRGADPTPFLSGPTEAARLLPPTEGRTWVRGRAVEPGQVPATLWALQFAEEELFRAGEKTRETVPVVVQPPVPAELPWLVGMKYPDIPVVFDETVITYLKHFRFNPGGRATIRFLIERSGRWRAMILNVLARHRLPSALLYVSMIESGFEVRTRSTAGALGLWQFMPDGAKVYGLRLSHFMDQRMDPELSTEAVMLYFSDLKYRFHNWHVALAAYNCGYGRMLQSIRRYQTNDFWRLQKYENALPRETQLYVPKWIAVAIADLNRDRFLIPKPAMDAAYTFDAVLAPGGMTLAQVARLSGARPEVITQLNPEYTRGRLPPSDKRTRVRIPWGRKAAYEAALLKLDPGWADFQPYRVQLGDTLESVAARFGTTTARIRSMNQLKSSGEVIAGEVLAVPRTTPLEAPVRPASTTPFVAVPSDIAVPDGMVRLFYRTTAGDTLELLCDGLGVTLADLIAWNHLNPEAALPSGMVLQVFLPPSAAGHKALFSADTVKVVPVDGEEFVAHYLAQYDRVRIRHVIAANQKLERIAEKYGTSVASIRTINKAYSFSPGTTIVVYARKDRAPKPAAEPADPAPAKPADPAPAKPADPAPVKPADPVAEKPADPAAAKPADPAPSKPADPVAEKPADPATEKPADPATEKPAEPAPAKPADLAPAKPADPVPAKPADLAPSKPADPVPAKPADPVPAKPADPATEKPADLAGRSGLTGLPFSRLLTDVSRVLINLTPKLNLTTPLKRDQLAPVGRVWQGQSRQGTPLSAPGPAPDPGKTP